MINRLAVLAFLLLAAATSGAETPNDKAAGLFARYVSLAEAFDPALADLYSDSAVITNKRTYPGGEVRELSLPASQYKALVKAAMPSAQARGDLDTYTDVSYATEGERVRITASRHSLLKDYTSPIVLVVGAGADGQWLILEEHTESRP